MPIFISCQCGKSYNLKDEFAGITVKCSNCGAILQVDRTQGSNVQERRQSLSNSVFNRDQFLLRQKALTTSEKYEVSDEQGNLILYIERPIHLLRNFGALLLGLITGTTLATLLSLFLVESQPQPQNDVVGVLLMLLTLFVVTFVTFAVISLLSKKRHITIDRDKSKQEPLLKILQDKKFEIPIATFTLRDTNGELAKFRKNYLYEFLYKHYWQCYSPDGSLLCVAKGEGSRGLVPSTFIIVQGNSDRVIGEFNREYAIRDYYVLDMSADRRHYLDRRIAIALGVMLITGEKNR